VHQQRQRQREMFVPLRHRPVSDKMAEIEKLAISETVAGDSIFMPFPRSFEAQLMRSLKFHWSTIGDQLSITARNRRFRA
jgi:hypothetical protein